MTHEETGLLVPPDDPEALAESALRIIEEPGLAERLATTGRLGLDQYSWGNVKGQWLELYEGLAQAVPSAKESRPARITETV